jgi:hypothetical protein
MIPFLLCGFRLTPANIRSDAYATTHLLNCKVTVTVIFFLIFKKQVSPAFVILLNVKEEMKIEVTWYI